MINRHSFVMMAELRLRTKVSQQVGVTCYTLPVVWRGTIWKAVLYALLNSSKFDEVRTTCASDRGKICCVV